MKYKKLIFTVITIMLLLSTVVTPVFAESTGFVTEPMTEEQLNTFYENVSISFLTEEPPKQSIDVFDVNENGLVAIGFSDFIVKRNKTICIYNTEGEFQYGYSFKCDGAYVIEFNNDNLNICYSRGDNIMTIDSTGNILSVVKRSEAFENNSYWQFLDSRKRNVGDVKYILENDDEIYNLFATTHSRLVIIDENGEKSIIYDATSMHNPIHQVSFIAVILFICIVVVRMIIEIIKQRRLFVK